MRIKKQKQTKKYFSSKQFKSIQINSKVKLTLVENLQSTKSKEKKMESVLIIGDENTKTGIRQVS